MRWVKHQTNAARDEKIAKLFDEHGHEGYGFYWMLLEVVAEKMDGRTRPALTFAEFSEKNWCSFTKVSTRKFRNFCKTMVKLGLIYCETNGKLLKIDFPNLLKYRDEYSRKPAKTPDKLLENEDENPVQETETETENKPPNPLTGGCMGFDEFAKVYPEHKHIAIDRAKSCWRKLNQVERMRAVGKVGQYKKNDWDEKMKNGKGNLIPRIDRFLSEGHWKVDPPKLATQNQQNDAGVII